MCQSLLSDNWNKGGLCGDGGSREENKPGRQMERYGGREGEIAAVVYRYACVRVNLSMCYLGDLKGGWHVWPKPSCHRHPET